MTVDEVREQVERVREMAGDDEAAHGAEDALRFEVLVAIANGRAYPTAADLAQAALATDEIDFARWCA